MELSREKDRAFGHVLLPIIGGGLAMLLNCGAHAKIVPYTSGVLSVGDRNVATSGGGVFSENVAVKSLTVGGKTFSLADGEFHIPIAVRLLTQQTGNDEQFDVFADNDIGKSTTAFSFAMSKDMEVVPGMTALDAVSSPDLGRLMQADSDRTTRMQIFLPLPVVDDDPAADDDSPEILYMGAVPKSAVKITPILAGQPDKPETLVFGKTAMVMPSTIESGATGVSMILGQDPRAQPICIVGLDLSGEFGMIAGQSVVGYQLDIPPTRSGQSVASSAQNPAPLSLQSDTNLMNFSSMAASGSAFKLQSIGLQEPGALSQAEDDFTQTVGAALLGAVSDPLSTPPLQTPPSNPPLLPPDPGPPYTPPVPPPPPPSIPAPGVLALGGLAGCFLKRGRRN